MATDPRINYAPRQGGNIPQMTPAPSWNMPQLRAFSPTAQNWEAGGHFLAQLIDAIAEARREDAETERKTGIQELIQAYLGPQETGGIPEQDLLEYVSPEARLTDGTLPVENALGFRVDQADGRMPLAEEYLRPRLDGSRLPTDVTIEDLPPPDGAMPQFLPELVSQPETSAQDEALIRAVAAGPTPDYGIAPRIPEGAIEPREQLAEALRVIPEIEEPGYITPDGTFVERDDERIGQPTQRYLQGDDLLTALALDPKLAEMKAGDINPVQQLLLERRIKDDSSGEWEDLPASYGERIGQPGVLFQRNKITKEIKKIADAQAPVKKSNPKAVIMGVAADESGLPIVINGKQQFEHAIYQDGEPVFGKDGQPLSFYAPKGASTEVNLNSNVVQASHPDMSAAMSTAWEQGRASKDQFSRASKMIELVETIPTNQFGAGAEMKRKAREWITIAADALGTDTPQWDQYETAHSVLEAWVNDFVLPRVKELGARPTDKDLQFIIDAMPNLVKTQKGNLVLIAAIRDLAERRMQEGGYMMDFLQLTRASDPKGIFTYEEGENQEHIGKALTRGYWERYRMMRDEDFAASQNKGMDGRQRENYYRNLINSFEENDDGIFEYQLSDDEFKDFMGGWANAT